MEKNTKILLGLAAVLVAYLVLRPKKSAQKSSNDPIMPSDAGSDVKKPKPDVDTLMQPDNQGVNGKYKFIKTIDVEVPKTFGSMGMVLSTYTYRFNVGDVIDVTRIIGGGPKVDVIKEQYRSVPFDVLEKVSDSTPITQNITKF